MDIQVSFNEIGFPLVVKPADSMGARGVKCCNTIDELLDWLPHALSFSSSDEIIIEEYIPNQKFRRKKKKGIV